MKSTFVYVLLIVACLSLGTELSAQWMTQSISLKPGWNAVFLEVDPEPAGCDAVFQGMPVENVWDFSHSVDAPQFVQDPGTLIPGTKGWLTWFPPNHPLASQRSLFRLRDGRPYLVKLAQNAQPVMLRLTGKPSLRSINWRAESLNFVGFRVNDEATSFQKLFLGENGLAGQPVYALDAAGTWRALVDLSVAKPKAGEAYWVRCRLPVRTSATIQVETGSSRGLQFDELEEQSLRVRNTSTGARDITVRLLPSAAPPTGEAAPAGPVPLEYWRPDYAKTNLVWTPLSAPITFKALPAGQEWNIRFGARRAQLSAAAPGSRYQSLLEVTDDLGWRWVVPVAAEPPAAPALAKLAAESNQASAVHTGLWVGEAVLNAVSQPARSEDPDQPRPAGGEFAFRLIIHVDQDGVARLLQHVFVLRKPPVLEPDPENPELNRVSQPARPVVVTDETLIPALIGAGDVLGRRISSAAFGFKEPLPLTGSGFGTGTLTGTVTVEYDDPLNPFKHAYHPDHNNLDERFETKLPEGKEAFTVTRALSLQFTETDPSGMNPPAWGSSELGGTYAEAVTGLHREPVHVGGTFRLVRVAEISVLNQ